MPKERRQERRLVTVLFADIVDSSASVSSQDPEVVRAALTSTFALVREAIVSHGGTVEKFIGDAVVAVFGMPIAHEDDAERAVRAALALREVELGGRDPRLTFRIGLNSGEVVSGDGPSDELLATGAPVVIAARLQQLAAPGEILIGPLTRALVQRTVDLGEPRTIAAKGIGPIEAWPVRGIVERGTRGTRTSRFVGRVSELDLLTRFLTRAASTGRAHLVTVFGDPGVGKSRLVQELLGRTGAPSLRAACLPYGRAITYWPLQEMIRLAAGISPTDDLATARTKIEAAVAAALGADAADAPSIVRQLSALAFSSRTESLPESGPPGDQRQELARALRVYLEARVGSDPAILVIEDLHWAEDPLLDLLDELLRLLRAPVLIVCVSRRSILDHRPSWGGGRANALSIDLEPLDPAETEDLVAEVLGDPLDTRIPRIAARTEGNPLFVEEYVRALLDQHSEDIPATLHGVIAARLDATPPPLRRLLQEASVLGRDFWLDALPSDLDPDTRGELMEEALERELVGRSRRPGPSGSPTYRFRHALIPEVAYASLSKADRSRLHDHYAAWLAAAAGDRAQDFAEISLYHAERAFELARAVQAPDANELGARAFGSLCRSASLAWGRADFHVALDLYHRALEVADMIGLQSAERVVAQGMAAIARLRLESSGDAIAELDRAIESARTVGPTDHLVRLLTWRASTTARLDDILGARALYAEAVDVARRTGDAGTIAYALWTSGEPPRLIGQLREHRRILTAALEHMRATGSQQWVVSCLAELSGSALEMGELQVARQQAEEAVEIAEGRASPLDRFRAQDALARALVAAEDPRAREVAERALALASAIGGLGPLAHVTEVVAEALTRDGDTTAAEVLVADTLGMLDAARMPMQRSEIARLEAMRARLAIARGDPGTARAAAEAAMRVAPRTDVASRVLALMAGAQVADADGRNTEAQRLLAEASEMLAATDHRALSVALERLRRASVRS